MIFTIGGAFISWLPDFLAIVVDPPSRLVDISIDSPSGLNYDHDMVWDGIYAITLVIFGLLLGLVSINMSNFPE